MKKPLTDLARMRRLAKQFEREGKANPYLLRSYTQSGQLEAIAHLHRRAAEAREHARIVTLAADAFKAMQQTQAQKAGK